MGSEHEEILREGIAALQKESFRVIRLDHRIVPDAIAVKDGTIIAVEASTNSTNTFLTRRKFDKGSQYDSEIIITRPLSKRFHNKEEYDFVMLENEAHSSYRNIRVAFKKKFGRTVSIATIHAWVKGESAPYGVGCWK